jgi:hypothetical protein
LRQKILSWRKCTPRDGRIRNKRRDREPPTAVLPKAIDASIFYSIRPINIASVRRRIGHRSTATNRLSSHHIKNPIINPQLPVYYSK